MNHIKRTLTFVVVAVVCVVVAGLTHWMSKPATIEGYTQVGDVFYPDFDDPGAATALSVVDFNEETATASTFSVEFKDGLWRIPSHYGYPADGKDRLAKTATSIIQIKRGALASRREADHERFGVIDPLDEEKTTLTGRGQRLTLKGEDGSTLVDLIIGKQKKSNGDDNSKLHYVRRADEKQTYVTELDIDLSTKFSDWIESDLLDLDSWDLRKLQISKPIVDAMGRIAGEETSKLSRGTSSEDWKLEGLNEETEEVNKDNVRETINALGDLKLVDVRPKPQHEGKPLLSANLEFAPPEGLAQNPLILQTVLQSLKEEMQSKGFFIFPDQDDEKKLRIYSREGDVMASTKDGIVYSLHFGSLFTEGQEEIKVGETGVAEEESEDGKKDENAETTKEEDEKTDVAKDDADKDEEKKEIKKNRYLFVRVSFDESAFEDDKPVEPVKPQKPPEVAEEESKKKDEAAEKTDKKEEENAEKKTDKPADDAQKKDDEKPDPKAEYEKALKEYETAKAKYDEDLKAYEEKVNKSKEKVQKLSDRFAEWYYVISAEDFDKLRLTRDVIVKPKEKKEEDKKTDADAKESAVKTPAESAKPKAEPAETKPAAETKAEEKPKAEPKPKAEEKPAAEAKPSDKPVAKPDADAKKAENKPAANSNADKAPAATGKPPEKAETTPEEAKKDDAKSGS